METITIREMEAGDIPRIRNLVEQLDDVFATSHDISLGAIRKTFTTMIGNKNVYVNYIALSGDVIVGFISTVAYKTFFHSGGTLLINELVVDRENRGKKIGERLLGEATEYARWNGLNEIEVGTTFDNKEAIAFYRKNGLVDESIVLGRELNG
jgi:GNAT superfamily N-acetyltransferase